MDLKEFAQEFNESAEIAVEGNGNDLSLELASSILEYLEDTGEVNVPEICSFKKTRARITAYDYNSEAESLDLFYFIKAETLLGKINNSKINQGFNYLSAFFREARDGSLMRTPGIEENDEIVEVAQLIQSTKGNINQLRLYVITDGLTDPSAEICTVESDDHEYIIEFNIWDMQRVYQQHNIRAGKEKVEIDFPTEYNIELQCLKMSEENPYIDAYMAIIPGITLAKIYKKYQQVLLEKNVRTFLQFKGPVNRGIRKTLREEPDMFFSYNNGISTTAAEIEFKEIDGSLYITRLYDWQIVNGGQTTASIAACLSDKEVSLSKVFVPMKISVVLDEDNRDGIVKAISNFANSQTAIKNSDFSANEPFLINLEKISRSEWVPNGNNKPYCKWYFERTRGQYLDQLAQLSGMNERAFKQEYPKNHKITKLEIARYVEAWNMHPYNLCKGAEANYKLFVGDVKKENTVVTTSYFKNIVAKGILYKTIDSIVRSKKLGGYIAPMDAYILSAISYLSNKKLNLTYIWEHQRVQQDVINKIEELIPLVWAHLTSQSNTGPLVSVLTWTKKPDCWTRLKLKLEDYDRFGDDLMQPETNEDGSTLNETQRLRIQEAEEFDSNYWFGLANWAKSQNLLSPLERKAAFNYGTMRSRNRPISSLKQAQSALKIVAKAKELGYKG